MSYKEEIIARLSDSSKWPYFSKPDVMFSLDKMADDALSVDNIDEKSCIASILIIQQLTEELLKVLLESCYFLVQVKLLPFEIEFKPKKGRMFGSVVDELKLTIEFENKCKIIELANKINKERIIVAHGLIDKNDFGTLPERAIQVRADFEVFFNLIFSTYTWIRLCLKDMEKEVFRLG